MVNGRVTLHFVRALFHFSAMLTRNKRAVLATSQNPLCAGLLQLVLEFVGPGYCLHAGTVCKAW
jgi:hypothetical protein